MGDVAVIDPLVEQIVEDLDVALVGPVRSLLGLDLADLLSRRITDRADMIAAQLLSHDRSLAAQTALDLAPIAPEEPDSQWWASPLGAAILRTYEPDQTVTQAEAARMLGITRQGVGDLIRRGKLHTTPLGVSIGSILERLLP